MIFRFVIKTVTTLAVGGMLVGWASLGGTPAARTLRAAAGSFGPCMACKSGAGPGGVAQPAPHKTKTKLVVASKKREHLVVEHYPMQQAPARH